MMRIMKASIGAVLTIAFVAISGCGKQPTPEQTFGEIMAVVRDIESGKRPNSNLDDYFYRSPHEKEGFGDVERIKMRALHQVILSRISSYSFGDKTAIDASTVKLAVHCTYKAPLTGVTASGTDEQVFVFVQDGREWKMDCGPRLTVGQDIKTNGSKLVLPRLLNLGAGASIPDKLMVPVLGGLRQEYADKFAVEFIDVWQDENAGTQYGVKVVPTQIFFDATGKERFRHTGFFSKEDILGKWKELGVDITRKSLADSVTLAKDNSLNIIKLVGELRVKGEKSADASIALIKVGSPAVTEICKAIDALGPALDNEPDASLLFGGITTLAMISKNEPSTMGDALPCLVRVAITTSNNDARTYIVCSIQLFGPSAVSHLMAFLDSSIKNPSAEDPDTMKAQGLVSASIINMVQVNPLEADAVIDQLKKCIDTASAKLKPVIVFQIANLAPASKSVVVVLQEQLESASDPAFKKQVQTALEFAQRKSPQ